MATFKRFEDIQIWQLARDLCKLVHKLTKRSPWNIDYKFKAQIESASGSVMDNIAEGFGRGGNREFVNFLRIAKGSAAEVQSQLIRALDKEYISRKECEEEYTLCKRISAGAKSLIDKLNESDRRGPNYRTK